MRPYTIKIPAGESVEIAMPGNYLRVKSASVTLMLTVDETGESAEIEQGDALELSPFSRVKFSHSDAAEQTVKVLIGKNTRMFSSQVGGSVTVSGNVEITNDVGNAIPVSQVFAAAFTQAAVAVGVASAQILAAKANRKFLLVQNNDAAANVFLNLTGAAATATDLKLPPGASIVLDQATPSAAITAIASAATAAGAVVVIEG